MKTAIYPGSFDPIHLGHLDVLNNGLQLFDKIYMVKCWNPEKVAEKGWMDNHTWDWDKLPIWDLDSRAQDVMGTTLTSYLNESRVEYKESSKLLLDLVLDLGAKAIIRGLRNGKDLDYEMSQQYWNRNLGITIPFAYFIAPQHLIHYSSTAARQIPLFLQRKLHAKSSVPKLPGIGKDNHPRVVDSPRQ